MRKKIVCGLFQSSVLYTAKRLHHCGLHSLGTARSSHSHFHTSIELRLRRLNLTGSMHSTGLASFLLKASIVVIIFQDIGMYLSDIKASHLSVHHTPRKPLTRSSAVRAVLSCEPYNRRQNPPSVTRMLFKSCALRHPKILTIHRSYSPFAELRRSTVPAS